jgi:pyruvate/2-oxoglutarate dehydrogenase complex dihydrolipoamide acyltransferase (E2) component
MPTAIYTPRLNNNDDSVRVAAVLAAIGSRVRAGDPIVDVETDKATFTVEATGDGYLLAVTAQAGDVLDVGSTLAWIGDTADEAIPRAEAESAKADAAPAAASLKALLLLKAHGLRPSDVPHQGRLTVADVERRVASVASPPAEPAPRLAPGRLEPFTPEMRGMIRSLSWHRDEVAAGYIECSYDPSAWDAFAAEFQKEHGLLLSPLLALMAWRLARLAKEKPRINACFRADGAYTFDHVNLGFTVQAGDNLYLVVVRDAESRSAEEFVRELGELQRAAIKRALKEEQTTDATIGFTSMARWNVTRHIPILAPRTSLMVAHSAAGAGGAVLGAAYDHRMLTGADVAKLLAALSKPA